MNQETKEALKQFFSTQKQLNKLGIIHSREYLEDIGQLPLPDYVRSRASQIEATGSWL